MKFYYLCGDEFCTNKTKAQAVDAPDFDGRGCGVS